MNSDRGDVPALPRKRGLVVGHNSGRDTEPGLWLLPPAMKRLILATLMCLGLAGMTASAVDAPAKAAKPEAEVAVLTFKDFGQIVLEFWPEVAPNTVENFKKLARQGFYDGTASHRLIPDFMIQLGDPLTKDLSMESRWGQGDPGYKIKAEFNERKHIRGVVSMARSPSGPDTAGSQFFICFATKPHLDGQYTTFGKLIKGADVLDKLEKAPIEGSKPVTRIAVESIKIVPLSSLK